MLIKKILTSAFVAYFFFAGIFIGEVAAEDYNEDDKVEAVEYTAPITLYWLSKAQVPEAIEYMSPLSVDDLIHPETIEDYARVEKANAIYQEILYTSLNDYIFDNDYKNVMDLGCGISPRGVLMARSGINYLGTDLETVAQSVAAYAPVFLSVDNWKFAKYVKADASNYEEMINAANNIDGRICIVEEGLLMYLTREQQSEMLRSIHDILKTHGGTFVTSDFVSDSIFVKCTNAIYSKTETAIIGQETKDLYEDISEILFSDTMFKSEKEARDFVKSHGLKIETRPLLTDVDEIFSMKDLTDKQVKNLRKVMGKKLLWIITVDE